MLGEGANDAHSGSHVLGSPCGFRAAQRRSRRPRVHGRDERYRFAPSALQRAIITIDHLR
jgi:hypothetical protein